MNLPKLSFGGLVIVGKCKNCHMYIWGPEGITRDEHGYCGISVQSR